MDWDNVDNGGCAPACVISSLQDFFSALFYNPVHTQRSGGCAGWTNSHQNCVWKTLPWKHFFMVKCATENQGGVFQTPCRWGLQCPPPYLAGSFKRIWEIVMAIIYFLAQVLSDAPPSSLRVWPAVSWRYMWQVLREILNQVQDDGGVVQDDEEQNHLCLIVYCSQ